MNSNATEGSCQPARPEQNIATDSNIDMSGDVIRVDRPAGVDDTTWTEIRDKIVDKLDELVDNARAGSCPAATPWCERHEYDPKDPNDEGHCWTRTIPVDEAQLAISNGTHDGQLKLWGLGELEDDAVYLDTARRVSVGIAELLEDVGATGSRTHVAAYTWRDLAATDSLLQDLQLAEADRDDLPLGSTDLRDDYRTEPSYGGMLVWNRTRDEETGLLVMLTGQTVEQERQVMANASWAVSCGAVYAASRVGMKSWKTACDDRVTVGSDEFLIWILDNDHDMSPQMRRRS